MKRLGSWWVNSQVQRPALSVGDGEAAHRPSDSHIGESALLLDAAGRVPGPAVGERALLHADDVYVGELQALGRMHGHQSHSGLRQVAVVGVGRRRHVREELVDGVVLSGCAHEFRQTLQPLRGLDRTLSLQPLQITGALGRFAQGSRGRGARPGHLLDHFAEPPNSVSRPGRQSRRRAQGQRLVERQSTRRGQCLDLGQFGGAHARARRAERTLDVHIVGGVGDAVGEHTCLARPGPGHHQHRPANMGDGLVLGRVEAVEDGRLRHRRASYFPCDQRARSRLTAICATPQDWNAVLLELAYAVFEQVYIHN